MVYMGMKNDVSFLIDNTMNIYEQQSTFNPNMPMRFLIYSGRLYSKYIEGKNNYHQYSSKLQKAPAPRCVCFYNGTREQEDRTILKLSDAFNGDADIQVEVTMINVNYGHNQKLLDACKPLKEYSWLIGKIRSNQAAMETLDDAVDAALKEMPDEWLLKLFLMEHKA